MPCRAARPRARHDEAGVARRDLDGETDAHRRALAGRDLDVLDAAQVEAGVVARARARAGGGGGRSADVELGSATAAVPSRRSARSAGACGPGRCARTRTPSGVSSRSISPASVVQLGEPPALGVGHEQLDAAAACARTRARCARAAPPGPRPWRAETSAASGWRRLQLAAALVVEQVGLVEHEQARRARRRRSPRARPRPRASSRGSSPPRRRGVERRAGPGRPASVSSSVAANASTSWCGSLRMKPTVSVSRYVRPSSRSVRVVGSSVWKRRSRTPTSAPVSAFSSVDLPALV